jgi:hypothetical protein
VIRSRWNTVVEELPPDRVVVIVGQDNLNGGTRNFSAWRDGEEWVYCDPTTEQIERERVRATDFWLTLPEWPAGSGAVCDGYPA